MCCRWFIKDRSDVDLDKQLELAEFEGKCSRALTVGLAEPPESPWQPSLRCLQHGQKGKDVISGMGYHFKVSKYLLSEAI